MNERAVTVPAGDIRIDGDLVVPAELQGVILFAHGSGSSRHSPRNRFVAQALQQAGFGTLLLDLLTTQEEALDVRTGSLRFDIGLLAERLVAAIDWLRADEHASGRPLGLFGASTGAAAALIAAAERPDAVAAVVSRGGRPDLAGDSLGQVKAPVLLIVGGKDTVVLALNRQAQEQLEAAAELTVVDGAGHLFEEPSALDAVARLATDWFSAHLS